MRLRDDHAQDRRPGGTDRAGNGAVGLGQQARDQPVDAADLGLAQHQHVQVAVPAGQPDRMPGIAAQIVGIAPDGLQIALALRLRHAGAEDHADTHGHRPAPQRTGRRVAARRGADARVFAEHRDIQEIPRQRLGSPAPPGGTRIALERAAGNQLPLERIVICREPRSGDPGGVTAVGRGFRGHVRQARTRAGGGRRADEAQARKLAESQCRGLIRGRQKAKDPGVSRSGEEEAFGGFYTDSPSGPNTNS